MITFQRKFIFVGVCIFCSQFMMVVGYCLDSEELGGRSPFDVVYISDENGPSLEEHEARLRIEWPAPSTPMYKRTNSEIQSHLNVTVGPFLLSYHFKLSRAYQKLRQCINERIDMELKLALQYRQDTLQTLRDLADELNVPDFCAEEIVTARDVAYSHVAAVWSCVRAGRQDLRKLDDYVGGILNATAEKEDIVLARASKINISDGNCVAKVSRSSVELGFELEKSVGNALRHSVRACAKLSSCAQLARDETAKRASDLATLLHNCVEA